jgi:hypothetical protein
VHPVFLILFCRIVNVNLFFLGPQRNDFTVINTMTSLSLSSSAETGRLGALHLKRYWEKCMARKSGRLGMDALQEEWNLDFTLLAALGLGLEQTVRYIYATSPDFDEFESWILEVNGGKLMQEKIDAFNLSVTGARENANDAGPVNPLTKTDIDFWEANGYLVLREVISKEDCESTIQLICDFIGIQKDDPGTWYQAHPGRQGIMVQLFQHPVLEKNRQSLKIKQAYEQLWKRKDIWVNTDRVGFNPPETETWKFPGPGLHWDVSLQLPIPFGLQGILYLNDTAADQGAFTLVPGFHHKIEAWLQGLPASANPRNENIHALGTRPVTAQAGDFIIWHHALPHGSSPNRSAKPRFVQYINYAPLDMEVRGKWI